MPRGIPRSKEEKAKENVVKAKDGHNAEILLDVLDKIKARSEQKLLGMIETHPVDDIAEIQREYQATLKIIKEVKAVIAEGKIASTKLKEDK